MLAGMVDSSFYGRWYGSNVHVIRGVDDRKLSMGMI